MHLAQNSAAFLTLARELAAFADHIGANYPLLSLQLNDDGILILWQYGLHDFIIRCTCEYGGPRIAGVLAPDLPTEIHVNSVDEAFVLILQTEQIRQNGSEFPYVRLGRMPGTK